MPVEIIQKNNISEVPVSLESERYLTARVLGRMAKLYGDRGILAAGSYAYFRWVDDIVDLESGDTKSKTEFLERQEKVIRREFLGNMSSQETNFQNLPWAVARDNKELLVEHSLNIIDIIKDDVKNGPAHARTHDEIRAYNVKLMLSSIEAVNIILNGRKLEPTEDFVEFVHSWNTVGSLCDFSNDLENGLLQLGFSDEQAEEINQGVSTSERLLQALNVYDKDRFMSEKSKHINSMFNRKKEFFNLNMPWWQQALSYIYIYRASLKAQLKGKYPGEEIISGIKHKALVERTRRLIAQNP